jgi:N-acetylglucosaminyldiphosphoundecaprenol N-acetyl-beta-D-mannosaminyltransferase
MNMMQTAVNEADAMGRLPGRSHRVEVAGMPFDLVTTETAEAAIEARSPDLPFDYVVTPNVDHIVRNEKARFSHLYEDAWLSVCDSRILARLAPIAGVRFPSVIPGSDLTWTVLERFVGAGESVCIIGCDEVNIQTLRRKFPHIEIHHFNPPMGFIKRKQEVGRAVEFVVTHPSRYVFLAVGSPQQEMLAQAIKKSGATGLGLCIGASILFLTGAEKRAPKWVQRMGMEWLYRLLQNPGRLWRRYLVDDLGIFSLIVRQRLRQVLPKER